MPCVTALETCFMLCVLVTLKSLGCIFCVDMNSVVTYWVECCQDAVRVIVRYVITLFFICEIFFI